jgi:hypothetical protein
MNLTDQIDLLDALITLDDNVTIAEYEAVMLLIERHGAPRLTIVHLRIVLDRVQSKRRQDPGLQEKVEQKKVELTQAQELRNRYLAEKARRERNSTGHFISSPMGIAS